jgi:hypothetical protein
MANKIKIKPGQTVTLKLTLDERELLLENLSFEDETVRLMLEGSQEVQLTLKELRDLGGSVAKAFHNTKDRKVQKKLDRISHRIEGLLELFEEA